MAGALLAAMRPGHVEFDPLASFKHTSAVAPSFSFRPKTAYNERENHAFGDVQLFGDFTREMKSMKFSAPKYSMRPRSLSPVPVVTPGPASYDVHPMVPVAPGGQFGSAERDKAFNTISAYTPKSPSPQEYDVVRADSIVQKAGSSWTMGARWIDRSDPEFRQSVSPRPGTHEYNITRDHVDLAMSSAPKYSMRQKSPSVRQPQTPAPGVYDIPPIVGQAHPYMMTGPQWQFGTTDREKAQGAAVSYVPQTPSPQDYHVSDGGAFERRVDQPTAPAWTLAGRHIDRNDAEFKASVDPSPGAHEYDITHEHVDLIKSKGPKYSIRGKHSGRRSRSSSPAPGAYDNASALGSTHPAIRNEPKYGFGSAHRDNVVGRMLAFMPGTPSPQDYRVIGDKAIGRVDQSEAPSWSMGVSRQDANDPEYKKSKDPTPGAHDYSITHDHVELTKGSAPKYSMRPRTPVSKSRSISPGPGSYNISRSLSRGASPESNSRSARTRCGFGSAQRFRDTKPDNRIYTY